MEIISFVQDSPRSKSPRLFFSKNNTRKNNNNNYYKQEKSTLFTPINYRPSDGFAISKVKNPLSIKSLFYSVGQGVSEAQRFIKEYFKTILFTFLSLALSFFVATFIFKTAEYKQNHTGPLVIHNEDSSDIEILNNLMASFALDNTLEYDENGFISGLVKGTAENQAITTSISYKQPVTYQNYKVKSGDTISGITRKFGLSNISTLISVNDIGNVRQLAAGQKLKIPSYDGIIYTVKKGDSLDSIVKANKIDLESLLDVNELSSETLTAGQQLFLPGASLDSKSLKTAMGDKFIMPIAAKFRWSSPYGARIDPIAGVKSFHTGTDMACPTGTPILASMSGKVIATGENRVYGLYVIIDHGNGYQTLYAHMSKIIATKGKWVSQGTRIGLVGSTGYSTGPHLHFTVYKNGKMINPMSVLK